MRPNDYDTGLGAANVTGTRLMYESIVPVYVVRTPYRGHCKLMSDGEDREGRIWTQVCGLRDANYAHDEPAAAARRHYHVTTTTRPRRELRDERPSGVAIDRGMPCVPDMHTPRPLEARHPPDIGPLPHPRHLPLSMAKARVRVSAYG